MLEPITLTEEEGNLLFGSAEATTEDIDKQAESTNTEGVTNTESSEESLEDVGNSPTNETVDEGQLAEVISTEVEKATPVKSVIKEEAPIKEPVKEVVKESPVTIIKYKSEYHAAVNNYFETTENPNLAEFERIYNLDIDGLKDPEAIIRTELALGPDNARLSQKAFEREVQNKLE